jgi:hypothetical protein
MATRRFTLLLVVVAMVRTASAHIVPIPPSTCRFDPVDFRVPATGLSGSAQTGALADTLRILYDASANQIQICSTIAGDGARCGGEAVARPFTLGPATGTLTLPALFQGVMRSSGDVTLPDLPLTLVVGGSSATIPVTLTTGLVAVDGTVVEGTPLQGLGSLILVGVLGGSALPPPIAGQSVLVRLSCQPRPVPDKDQFVPDLQMTAIKGQITSGQVRLRASIDIASATPPDLVATPVLLAVNVDGTEVASAVVSSGLQGRGRLSGTSDDARSTITVRQTARRLLLTALLRDVTLPPPTPGAPVIVDVTLDGGGRIGRGEQLFRTNRSGKRLAAAEG